jgi:hypothetical protein
MKFKRTVIYTGETSLHTPAQFLDEVNRDRSESWTPYTMHDALTIPNEIINEWMTDDYEAWETIR